MHIGIVSFGLYLPEGYEDAATIAAKAGLSIQAVIDLGVEQKRLPAPDDQPIPMAVKAAQKAFARTDIVNPADVDVVIWTGEEYKDYIAQTASIRLQEEVGCRNAWAFDLVGQGVTSHQGLRVAHDLMRGDESIKTVLLAGGTRNVDLVDYANPHTRILLATSASGGALILKRDHDANHLLKTAFTVDAEMADEIYVPGGGTETPFAPENVDSKLMYFQVANSKKTSAYMKKRWVPALVEVTQKVLSDRAPDYLALRHLAPGQRREVLNQLGVSSEQSASLAQLGYHGTNDVIVSLDLGLNSGAVRKGNLVTLVSGGIGFTYAAALIQWGP